MSVQTIELVAAASPQTLTGSWADLGGANDLNGYDFCRVWLDIDINDSLDIEVRPVLRMASGGSDYKVAPNGHETAAVQSTAKRYEIVDDIDQKICLELHLEGDAPFVKFQIKVGTVGATAGKILSADLTY